MARSLRKLGPMLVLLSYMVGVLFAQTDSDGDGIPDDVEKNGLDITLANGKKQHSDLAGMGASPTHKDIFVWVDWMAAPDHTHRPLDAALAIVQNAMRDAPISSPDGRRGIALHVVVSPIPVIIVQANSKLITLMSWASSPATTMTGQTSTRSRRRTSRRNFNTITTFITAYSPMHLGTPRSAAFLKS